MAKKDNVLASELYPLMVKAIESNGAAYKACIGRFISYRNKELYDIAPCDRIYFGQNDLADFYKSIGVTEAQIKNIISKTYYFGISNFNPRAAKDEFTMANLMIIRYFFLKNKQKELELSMVYLAFSGKFYPSIHYSSFPYVQPSEYRHVMEYVINNKLSNKFDIKTQGHVLGAIRSICTTWINTYKSKFRDIDDTDAVYLIQQLHNRIKSFMRNIAKLYYESYEDRDYLTYDSEDHSEEGYRLVGSDSQKAAKAVEKAMTAITQSEVDYKLCKMASDMNVHTEEVKSIVETILNSPNANSEIRELITLLVYTYFEQSKEKDIRDISFITFSIAPKPNTKDPHILREKEIVENWLNEKSPAYRKRKKRIATKNSYHRAVYAYFTLVTHNANK